MNRQKAIEIITGLYRVPVENGADKFASEINKAIDMAIEALQDDWIPVSERLPEDEEDVLVTVYFMGLKQTHTNGWSDHIKPRYYVDIACRFGEKWSSASDEYRIAESRHKTIAWKPLPEPYKAESEEV